MNCIKNLILIILYQVIYILFANASKGAMRVRMASPNSIPIIPVKKIESSTIIDTIMFCTICCVLRESLVRILMIDTIIMNENNASGMSDSSLKNPIKENNRIEEIMVAMIAGGNNNFVLSEKPRTSYLLTNPINDT